MKNFWKKTKPQIYNTTEIQQRLIDMQNRLQNSDTYQTHQPTQSNLNAAYSEPQKELNTHDLEKRIKQLETSQSVLIAQIGKMQERINQLDNDNWRVRRDVYEATTGQQYGVGG